VAQLRLLYPPPHTSEDFCDHPITPQLARSSAEPAFRGDPADRPKPLHTPRGRWFEPSRAHNDESPPGPGLLARVRECEGILGGWLCTCGALVWTTRRRAEPLGTYRAFSAVGGTCSRESRFKRPTRPHRSSQAASRRLGCHARHNPVPIRIAHRPRRACRTASAAAVHKRVGSR
jgi:hypothetical protein